VKIDVNESQKYQKVLKSWEVPASKTTEQAWAELQPKLATTAPTGKVIAFNWKPLAAVAAAAVVVLGFFMFSGTDEVVTYSAAAKQQIEFLLPDESVVDLNAGSTLTYGKDWSENREVNLKGEAFFQVRKGSKFNVKTDRGTVEVLGTSFNVKSRGDDFQVECRTGKVRVSVGEQQITITPGQSVNMSNGQLALGEFDLLQKDWREGVMTFEEAGLKSVFEEIERQFNVKVKTPELKGRSYTGTFTNTNLNEALQAVCMPMGLKFNIQDDMTIVVSE
jgi:transmembrane sensor